MKNTVTFWFIVFILWVSLACLVFEKSTELKFAISKMVSKETYIYLINRIFKNESEGVVLLNETWYQVCQTDFNLTQPMELIPNCNTRPVSGVAGLESYYININSGGFRGREYTTEKPADVFRIIVLGDSFVFGWGLNLEETFSYRLEKLLNSKYSGKNFEVLNFGVPGMNTAQEVEHFRNKALSYNPDLVIVGFVGNDDESLEYFLLTKDYRSDQLRAIRADLDKDTTLKHINLVKSPLEELVKISKGHDFKTLIYAFNPGEYQCEVLNEFAKSNSNIYFQKASFSELNDKKFYLHPLDPHPSSLANELYAQEIYEAFIKHGILPP